VRYYPLPALSSRFAGQVQKVNQPLAANLR
jgi:hypothetical protein